MRFLSCHTHTNRACWLGLWVLLIASQTSWAAGTPAGTVISNLAKASYDIGGGPQIVTCSSPAGNSAADDDGVCVTGAFGALNTDFRVDNKVDLLVTEGNTLVTTVVAGQTAAVTTFSVLNEGNTTQDFALSVANLATGTANPLALPAATNDNFDGTGCTVSNIVIAVGTMGTYTALDQHINALQADSSATVTVTCNIPAAQANGSLAIISLTATARTDNAANTLGGAVTEAVNTEDNVEVVFGDSAGSDDTTGVRDAEHSARDAYYVQTATLTVTKTASVLDPQGGSVVMPTAVITYQIAVSLGAGTATGLVMTDPLPANTTYLANSISITCNAGTYAGGGACGIGTIAAPQPAAAKTDTNLDADFVDFNGTTANTITVLLGDVSAPVNFVITFKATIN